MSAMSTGSPSTYECNWDAESVLDFYIHDYMLRKNYADSADIFLIEGQVLPMAAPAVNDAEDGFLREWWSLFTDVYFPHTSRKIRKLEESHAASTALALPQLVNFCGTDSSVPQNLPSQQISCVRPLRNHQLADRPPQGVLVLKAQDGPKSSAATTSGDVEIVNDGSCLQRRSLKLPQCHQESKDVSRCTKPTNQVDCSLSRGTEENLKDIICIMRMKQLARLHGQPKSSLVRPKQAIQGIRREGSAMAEAKGLVPAPDPHGIPTRTDVDLEHPNTGLNGSLKRKQFETLLASENVESTEGMSTGGPSPVSAGIPTQFPALQPSISTSGGSNTVEEFHGADYPAMGSPVDLWPGLFPGALQYDMEQVWTYEGALSRIVFAEEIDLGGRSFGELDSKERVEHTLDVDTAVGTTQFKHSHVL